MTAFVAAYVALGFVFHPDVNSYLLLGIPLTLAFQVLVARCPPGELWLRNRQFCVDRWTIVWFVVFLIEPVRTAIASYQSAQWPVALYGVIAVIGAAGAAMAYRVLGRSNLGQLALLVLLMLPIGFVRLWVTGGFTAIDASTWARVTTAISSLFFYVPATFVVEEVFFRGALDTYLHRGEPGAGWFSAAFVSVLWGLWHTPLVHPLTVGAVAALVLAQLVMGLILSWFWRRTGNLAMPATVHAVIDAVRNGFLRVSTPTLNGPSCASRRRAGGRSPPAAAWSFIVTTSATRA